MGIFKLIFGTKKAAEKKEVDNEGAFQTPHIVKYYCKCNDVSKIVDDKLLSLGSPVFYLTKDSTGQELMKMLPDGIYALNSKTLIINNESLDYYA